VKEPAKFVFGLDMLGNRQQESNTGDISDRAYHPRPFLLMATFVHPVGGPVQVAQNLSANGPVKFADAIQAIFHRMDS
jgi:hypothetical protein